MSGVFGAACDDILHVSLLQVFLYAHDDRAVAQTLRNLLEAYLLCTHKSECTSTRESWQDNAGCMLTTPVIPLRICLS